MPPSERSSQSVCPHCGRKSRTIRGLCANCGRLKREEDIDFADMPSVEFSFFSGLTDAILWVLAGLLLVGIGVALVVWLAINAFVVVLLLTVVLGVLFALSQMIGW